MWLPLSKKKPQMNEKWLDGVFLGIKDDSEEAIVGTAHGCFTTRSIRRRAPEDRADPLLLNHVCGAPWALVPPKEPGSGRPQVRAIQIDVARTPSRR